MSSTLVKRLALETQPLSKSAIGAIAGAAVFLVLFFIGIGVFLWFYIKSSKVPGTPHVGSFDDSKVDLEAGANEKSFVPSTPSSLVPSTPSSLVPSTIVPPSPAPAPAKPMPAHLNLVDETPESASANRNTISTTVPPTSSRKSRLQVDSQKAAGYDWNRTSTVSSSSLEIPPTPGKDFV
ncbi:hypothetical protein BZA05DRAFT_165578 [Tricharina praecox]|uniref:uncharacterized protein n=1 Tax=Tricharina praecox TaxID=43433 RepID=UPI00222087C0|nr:uncharacterized protein BZA05DRAFT_165578 [Tricharina praecox]KAI5857074.1 hypothetical protein BZA05DRAFT_165578 [Tricharina praecox]